MRIKQKCKENSIELEKAKDDQSLLSDCILPHLE